MPTPPSGPFPCKEEEEACALAHDELLFARMDALAEQEERGPPAHPSSSLPPPPEWWSPGAEQAQPASLRHDWLERVLSLLSEELAGGGRGADGAAPAAGPLALLMMAQRMGAASGGRGRHVGLPAHLLLRCAGAWGHRPGRPCHCREEAGWACCAPTPAGAWGQVSCLA